MAPRSSDWVTDPRTGKSVRWSNSQEAWVDRDGRIVSRSRRLDSAPAGASSSSSRRPQEGPSRPVNIPARTTGNPRNDDDDLARSFRNLAVSPSAHPTRQDELDDTSDNDTVWDYIGLASIQDPFLENSRRDVNLKRIRERNGQASRRQGYGPSQDPDSDFKPGRVIEVLLIPPQANGNSTVSKITPRDGYSTGRLRLRRFVVITQRPGGRNCFQALAIKTYNFLGVASPGVIKFHHAIIYTSKTPRQASNEQPTVMSAGHMDRMQPQAIRVAQRDKTTALDPMSRLDYADIYEFGYDFPNIKVFGKVHDNSRAAFRTQFENVWATLHSRAAGVTGSGSLERNTRDPSEPAEAETPRAGPGSVVSSRTVIRPGGPVLSTAPNYHWAQPNSGPITEPQMRQLLREYEEYAHSNGLSMPEQKLTAFQVQGLAVNSADRATYLQRVRSRWTDEADEDEDSDEEESSEEEEEDD